jgi:hypothetical protein
MFVFETMQSLHRNNLVENCLQKLRERESIIADVQNLLSHWQVLPELSTEDIRNINTAFYKYICSEMTQLLILGNSDFWHHGGQDVADEFIKLLLPLKSEDVAERVDVEFLRQEMFARVSYIFEKINDVAMFCLEESEPEQEIDLAFFSGISCPLDSAKIFMQYLNNHISDGNWQKIAGSKNHVMSRLRQKNLLETEYRQCQYTPGDPDYVFCENQYRVLSEQIESDYNERTIGCNAGVTPWTLRNILKRYVSIPHREETRRWTWQKYSELKSAVNGTPPPPVRQKTYWLENDFLQNDFFKD